MEKQRFKNPFWLILLEEEYDSEMNPASMKKQIKSKTIVKSVDERFIVTLRNQFTEMLYCSEKRYEFFI